MRTKTMFAVLAASACAFAADFPTDQNAVITAPSTYTAAGNLSWATLAVGGAGAFSSTSRADRIRRPSPARATA